MELSESAGRLRAMIDKAIEDHEISRAEMDMIINIAGEDGHIDRHEASLLEELQNMIENKEVKITK